MSPALIVFARPPVPGRVKTRLVPPLSPDEAAALYAAFLGDALAGWTADGAFGLDAAPGAPGPAVRLYLADGDAGPEHAEPERFDHEPREPAPREPVPREPVLPERVLPEQILPAGLVPAGVSLHRQRGDGLGPRMLRAFVETFAAGHDRAVVIGTDHPTLPAAFVGEAFRALDEPFAVVLGPSDDGGYYLLGLNEVLPALFDGMAYSHPAVFEQTLARAFAAGGRPAVLPSWYDVDTAGELVRLLAEWRGGTPVGPRTAVALVGLAAAHPELLGG